MNICQHVNISGEEVLQWLIECDEKLCPPKWSEKRLRMYAEKLSQNAYFTLGYEHDSKIGFIAYYLNTEGRFAYITITAITPLERGKGHASALFNNFFENLSADMEYVSLEVSKNNTSAMNLYVKFGFILDADNGEKLLMKKILR
ncbi:GNAT family N-acetyltransferase [Bacteroides congonensis]|uniref:GNAT family N-acetyltransferase n=1 Tax=Bacteroides congonensis TaxID=1871006 RepID=UPI002FD8EE91